MAVEELVNFDEGRGDGELDRDVAAQHGEARLGVAGFEAQWYQG